MNGNRVQDAAYALRVGPGGFFAARVSRNHFVDGTVAAVGTPRTHPIPR